MIVRALTNAYQNVYKISTMKNVAADGDFFNFINSFPNIENSKNPKLQYAFHALAATLAKKEGLITDYKQHIMQVKMIEKSFK